jgi:transcriptional regulator with AAA-type ATPase domain/Tfp pilus assembly protein PilF
MSKNPSILPRFDCEAQERIAALFRRCPPLEVIAALESYAPPIGDERPPYEKYYGWALYEAGDYEGSRGHLFRALHASPPRSADRAMVRGLLGEAYLRTGHLDRAEKCAHRALARIPASDTKHYLRGGHLCLLGRVYRRQGHLTHAIETYRRGLSLVDDLSSHRAPLATNLAVALLHHDRPNEADAVVREQRAIVARQEATQDWCFAVVESAIAIELDDLPRAEAAIEAALRSCGERFGERVELVLLEHRAAIFRARGEWRASETLLRTILDRSELGGRNGDMMACAARGLAESLIGQERFDIALDPARLAVRAGRAEDRAEWAAGMRLEGQCLAALGRIDDAHQVFQEALSLHERTQFTRERRRLLQTMVRTGFSELAEIEEEAPIAEAPVRTPTVLRAPLSDGRVFLTLDADLLHDLSIAAAGELPALIEGETGTGKEIVARLLHERGPRASGPFVVVDCTTLPPDLADVELFGATRGAYTGAHRDRPGLIAQADGGTLFLDELPELSRTLQAKLLRVLQEGSYRRIGEDQMRRVRVRFIAATNRNVERLLRDGGIKPDLYYRLNGYRVALRPLRARRDEIGPLADEIVRRCGLAGVTPIAQEALRTFPWPGNVRQLEMLLRVVAGRCEIGSQLDLPELEAHMTTTPATPAMEDSLRSGRIAGERAALERALDESGGVVSRAARSLGLSRQAFYKAMQRTGLGGRTTI